VLLHVWMLCGGVGAGVINAQLDSVMSRKLRLSTVPSVVAVVDSKLHWFDRQFSVQHLREFVRGLHPHDLIQEVFLSHCHGYHMMVNTDTTNPFYDHFSGEPVCSFLLFFHIFWKGTFGVSWYRFLQAECPFCH